ncbi:glycoside hydrolase family 55 protein [Thermothelomyces thermophilus ATCC 42464]|uniref:Glycoside hydrolase family 55 protein n=1 Tax=Thermothelomyces thermophilus (strain ATCC 42464 / BCRC 31852 / DSM 1799) TaxID=573729 RepID=G2PZK7_THET4|nr:glycoside hydrolase family 55 protein [Thermothelomyces thermophilus ATCC 42464]AEO55693.1 glycoside hydrolase family 55 protein [Thermothelomyces thermophilus ATCC 42464]
MRRLSLRSLLAVSTLVSGIAASVDLDHQGSDASTLTGSPKVVTTVVITKTLTTCPSSSAVCSDSTGSASLPPSSTAGSRTESSASSISSPSSSSTSSAPSSASSGSSSGSSSSTSSSSAGVPACTDFWLENIKHQGVAPFAGSGYEVFRNVKDYGAKGDGVSDDTEAINRAISDGKRCGPGCTGSTKTPGLVYFPPGTYMVSGPIIDFYYTQLIGNPGCMPVLKATSDFEGRFLLDTNPYGDSGSLAWGATNVFWRQVANLIIDTTDVPAETLIAGIHWPSSQATSLSNIVFRSSAAEGTQHQGLFVEEGSGGFMGDLVFFGGAQAMSIGNQQFTMRNITVRGAKTAVQQLWSWGWTYQGVSIRDCEVGFDFTAVDQGDLKVGSVTILDSEISNTPIGIKYGAADTITTTSPDVPNNFVFENLRLDDVPTAIRGPSGTVLAGSSGQTVIEAWGRGHAYTPSSSGPTSFEGPVAPNARPASLVAAAEPGGDAAASFSSSSSSSSPSSSSSSFYQRSKPQYEDVPASEFVSARAAGARGDGATDDTDALNDLFASAAAAGKIVFLDAGMYVVTRTVRIPPGSRIVGEAFPVILSSGDFFASASAPKPVVQVGAPGGEAGRVEWSNTIVSTRGSQPGAILIEYNLDSSSSSSSSSSSEPSGLWDVHARVGGFAGSELQLAQCAKTPETAITADNLPSGCVAAFLTMHVTRSAAGLYMENCWLWVADHDLEEGADNRQISVYAGRGLLVEGTRGPLWLVGTSVEHHQLYEYQLVEAADVYMGQIQTETAYYQPNPDGRLPFPALEAYHDPVLAEGESGWGLRVVDSEGVLVYGAGLYSFFDNYDVNCIQIGQGARCQRRIFSLEGANRNVRVYNLNTVGTNKMITVDGVDVANYEDNIDGFVHSIALFGLDA